jgi:hypothetical protein
MIGAIYQNSYQSAEGQKAARRTGQEATCHFGIHVISLLAAIGALLSGDPWSFLSIIPFHH